MLKQVHLYIRGDVIGVGFRAWTKIQAKIIGVNGWVRNVFNQDVVEAQIQGEENKVKEIIDIIKKENPQILGLSALLTTSTHQIGVLIEELKKQGLRDNLKVMIGGASVDATYAARVGADGYAIDAVSAVAKAKELVGTKG